MSAAETNAGTQQAIQVVDAPSTTLSSCLAQDVLDRGTTVFGVMGNGNANFVSDVTTANGRYVSTRHESGTVVAAQSYYLASGKTAVATTTYGPGFGNLITPLAEARMARIPMVLVLGDAPTSGPRREDIDQTLSARALDVQTLYVRPDNAAWIGKYAFELAERDLVPVILSVPYDLQGAPLTEQRDPVELEVQTLQPHEAFELAEPSAEEVKKIALALAGAKRPLIVGGRGVHLARAGKQLRTAGDQVGALFSTTLMGRGVFQSQWDIGIVGGFSAPLTAELLQSADVVLIVGASTNLFQMRYNTLFDDADVVIQVDVLPEATYDKITQYVRADALKFSNALMAELEIADFHPSTWRAEEEARISATHDDICELDELAGDGRLDPRVFMTQLSQMMPNETSVVQDTGHFFGWAPRYWPAKDPEALVVPGAAFLAIGLGMGAGVGVAAARPDRLTVLISGDGGASMGIADLDTFIRVARSGLVVILNDAAYGMEIHQYAINGFDDAAMVFPEVDYAAVGRAFGAQGSRITSIEDLRHVQEWLDDGANGVYVADVVISGEVVADWLHASNVYYGRA